MSPLESKGRERVLLTPSGLGKGEGNSLSASKLEGGSPTNLESKEGSSPTDLKDQASRLRVLNEGQDTSPVETEREEGLS